MRRKTDDRGLLHQEEPLAAGASFSGSEGREPMRLTDL